MKAITHYQYGLPDVLRLEEIEKPTPGDNEILIKVYAVSLNGSDWEGLRGKPLYARIGGLFRPGRSILGSDIAGRVEAIGGSVTRFRVGDAVFGEMAGYGGGFAEYACTSEKLLLHKPIWMTFEQAATIPQGGVIALQGIRDEGQVQPGQKVLINGAGGSAGLFAVQIAKGYGAEVTGVDNTFKLDFMRSLGADHVIDYNREDFTKNRNRYDLILDMIAYRSVFAYARALTPNGSYYCVGGSVVTFLQMLLFGPWIKRTTGKRLNLLVVRRRWEDLLDVVKLVETGKVIPVIDRQYLLSETPQALRHLGEGRAKGKVVIVVHRDQSSQ